RGATDAMCDAVRAPECARGDLRDRSRVTCAEHPPAQRARHGRRARPRSCGRRLAAASTARGSGRLVDPAPTRGENAFVSSVERIVRDVSERGDAALREWALRLDDAAPARAVAGNGLPAEALLALADAVRRWHELQRPPDVSLEMSPGIELERRWVPLRSVGIYVPRGLVSTLVMCAVPAQVAGVERIVVMTPPAGSDLVAAAADALGVDEVWAIGGPQAIAALAYGTDSITRVDKIVGPGNRHVNEAKLLVADEVAIDLPAGPSEVVVLAGADADLHVAELELAAQAEHGPDTVCRIVNVNGNVERALEEIEALAPEHLVLLGADVEKLAASIRNAGAVF